MQALYTTSQPSIATAPQEQLAWKVPCHNDRVAMCIGSGQPVQYYEVDAIATYTKLITFNCKAFS